MTHQVNPAESSSFSRPRTAQDVVPFTLSTSGYHIQPLDMEAFFGDLEVHQWHLTAASINDSSSSIAVTGSNLILQAAYYDGNSPHFTVTLAHADNYSSQLLLLDPKDVVSARMIPTGTFRTINRVEGGASYARGTRSCDFSLEFATVAEARTFMMVLEQHVLDPHAVIDHVGTRQIIIDPQALENHRRATSPVTGTVPQSPQTDTKMEDALRNLWETKNYSDMTIICAGSANYEIQAHKNIVCTRSTFFAGAFRPGFPEALTGRVTVQETRLTMTSVLEFLYAVEVDCFTKVLPAGNRYNGAVNEAALEEVTRVYIAGDKYGVVGLKERAMKAYHERITTLSDPVAILENADLVFDNTPDTDTLIRPAIAFHVQCFLPEIVANEEAMHMLINMNVDLNSAIIRSFAQYLAEHRAIMQNTDSLAQAGVDPSLVGVRTRLQSRRLRINMTTG